MHRYVRSRTIVHTSIAFLPECIILSLIDKINLNEALANYLLVRLIYPSYIFKLYDIFIETKELNKKFYEYMKKSREYETLLSTIYNKLKLKYSIKAYIYFFKDQY